MKLKQIVILICLFIVNQAFAQNKAELISFEKLQEKIKADNESIFVINFWATWCGPCLAELPDFEKFYNENKNPKIKLLLVSLDFSNETKKVNRFIEKKGLKPNIYLLSNTDQNAFIEKVSKKWEGTIPATWFINSKNKKEYFVEKQINKSEINQIIKEFL